MKKILLLLCSLALFINIGNAYAQENNNNHLTVIHYQTREDIDVISKYSKFNAGYFQGEDIKIPFFLGLFNDESLKSLKQQGFNYEILIKNINDLSSYIIIVSQKDDAADILDKYGEYWQLSDYYYLFKIPDGNFSINMNLSQYGFLPILIPKQSIPTPIYRSATITRIPQITGDLSMPDGKKSQPPDNKQVIIGILIFFILVIILALVIFIFYKKRPGINEIN